MLEQGSFFGAILSIFINYSWISEISVSLNITDKKIIKKVKQKQTETFLFSPSTTLNL